MGDGCSHCRLMPTCRAPCAAANSRRYKRRSGLRSFVGSWPSRRTIAMKLYCPATPSCVSTISEQWLAGKSVPVRIRGLTGADYFCWRQTTSFEIQLGLHNIRPARLCETRQRGSESGQLTCRRFTWSISRGRRCQYLPMRQRSAASVMHLRVILTFRYFDHRSTFLRPS
jgi:hypothetical protein